MESSIKNATNKDIKEAKDNIQVSSLAQPGKGKASIQAPAKVSKAVVVEPKSLSNDKSSQKMTSPKKANDQLKKDTEFTLKSKSTKKEEP